MAGRIQKRPRRPKDEAIGEAIASLSRVPAFLRGAILKEYDHVKLFGLGEEGQHIVSRWPLAQYAEEMGGDEGLKAVEALAAEIVETAQSDANELGGHQRYAIVAHDKKGQQAGRLLFRVTGDGEVGEDDAPGENASPRGLVAQLMRHVENRERANMNSYGDILFHYKGLLDAQAKEIESYRRTEIDTRLAYEQLISGVHDREMAQRAEARKEQLQGHMLAEFGRFLPIIGARLLSGGKKGVKPDPILGEEIVKNLLGSIANDPDKLSKIAMVLGPNETAQVVELVRMYAAKEEEKTKALEAKKNGSATS